MCSSYEPPGDHSHPGELVEKALLGDVPRYRKGEVAELVGVELTRAERLWQAMGFAHVGDDDVVFTDFDVTALRMVAQLVSAEVIKPELETAVARSLGQSMSRLAEWQLGIFKSVVGDDLAGDVTTTAQFAEAILPIMEHLQGYVWRRHLAAIASREMSESDARTEEPSLVVGFADIVGYTRLVRDFSEIELARLIDDFEDLVTRVIAENRGRIVKTVGDEVLFVTDTVAEAAEIALALNEGVAEEPRLPPLRIGLASGRVLERFGDVYGSTVNIASRLTTLARPASVLVDEECARLLRGTEGLTLTFVGPNKVQGFRGLRAWALRRGKRRR